MTLHTNDTYYISSKKLSVNNKCIDFKKKRCQQLQKLSQEHNDCIPFAEKIAQIAEHGDSSQLLKGIELVQKYNETELEAHLKHEEQTIFAILVQHHREHLELCISLGREHGFIRTLVEAMTLETAQQDLADLAHILKHHTLEEEMKLFPVVESLFTEEQLDAVLDFIPWH
ncbi:MAG: hemerythrin domain-containing protein [gamma proteobacterium symbiont of Lucinoma myriamae]|nr:hemerythrin domain-containing protein [gamma proteobacterium symbiont of Lucinoma myriamae]MCU7819929.1 hemerythrin domain-containing protein [gamma proteobacterium symbiont of Lucinoma myriamae]MCU7831798.1 hemerythrin domain-containing protein [gamma proteobacterium symbiont of Lucinoma myriamae]